jgi:hypothetical protein
VIIITGLGRSGTSVLAHLYSDLGFDPGGHWNDDHRAGFEADDVLSVNSSIADELGVSIFAPLLHVPSTMHKMAKPLVPVWLRGRIRSRQIPFLSRDRVDCIQWECLQDVVARHRERVLEISDRRPVAKDPQFCFTLGVWAEIGVPIDHIFLCIRDVDASVRSRRDLGITGHSEDAAKNLLMYGFGASVLVAEAYGLEYTILRFPEFIENPEDLYQRLRFPEPVTSEQFCEVFNRVVRRELVHNWS